MTWVTFGNPSPQMQEEQDDGSTISVPAPHLNQSVTSVQMWDGFDDEDFVALATSTRNDPVLWMISNMLQPGQVGYSVGVHELFQIINVHSAGSQPAWVDSDDLTFRAALAGYFDCPEGDPTMLITYGGRDALHQQHLQTSPPAPFQWLALTASTTAPTQSDTTLPGEITTASGGLLRAQGTVAHTAGTNTSTVTRSFVANSNDSLPVTIAQSGLFNQATSGGTLGYHTALNSPGTLQQSGDSISLTETPAIG